MKKIVVPSQPAPAARLMERAAAFCRQFRGNREGASTIEFALVLPILTTLGMYGAEIANMQIVRMQVSQMAISVADNASRLQQTNNNVIAPTLTEADVDSIMKGAEAQGRGIRLSEKGRVILSSLEADPVTGKQFIHWQRCAGGKKAQKSRYGDDGPGNGLNGNPMTGMGGGKTRVAATPGTAVMFAEVYYDYEGIFGELFVRNFQFSQEAAFVVRDVRDLRAANLPGITGTGGKSKCT